MGGTPIVLSSYATKQGGDSYGFVVGLPTDVGCLIDNNTSVTKNTAS